MQAKGRISEAKKARLKKIPLVEAFGPTIQGEGILVGTLTYFLRFGLCDYECKMCDSMHAVDPMRVRANAQWLTQEDIFEDLYALMMVTPHVRWVTLSGGNPCIHNLTHLVNRCRQHDIKVAVETQGTMKPDWLKRVSQITVSPKSPGMGEKFEQDKFEQFLESFHKNICVKVVVFTVADLEFAAHIRSIMNRYKVKNPLYLSLGNHDVSTNAIVGHRSDLLDNYAILVEEIGLDSRLGDVAFLPQLHTLAWGNKQGH